LWRRWRPCAVNVLAVGAEMRATTVSRAARGSWSIASRLAGQDTVLFLPWHEYFPTPFTDQRVIANPAAFYFAGTVLTSSEKAGA
jgi:hypothetical protein